MKKIIPTKPTYDSSFILHIKRSSLILYGWRARIGLLVPSSNTTMEMEFHRVVPEGISVHTARMAMPEVKTLKEKVKVINQMNKETYDAAEKLASAEVTVIVYGCTLGSFTGGISHDLELSQKIQDITSIRSLTVSNAVVDAMRTLRLKRISVVTPYVDEINRQEKDFLEQSLPGLEVLSIKGMGIIGNIPKGRLDPFSSYEFVREAVDPRSDGIFLSCTNWRTFEIIEHLEEDLNKPVITSNQAALWAAMRHVGISDSIQGHGCLLRTPE